MRKLESLVTWKVANQVATAAYRMTMAKPIERHYALADQIRRASLSIPANMAEGYALSTRSQLIRCLRIALGSACELKCHLVRALDLELVRKNDTLDTLNESDRLVGLLVGLLKSLGAQTPT